MLLRSHLSIAGGLHHALEKAAEFKFDVLAMFLRNQQQWRAAPLSDEAAAIFRDVRKKLRIGPIVAHGSYLLNLGGQGEVRRKGIDAMIDDVGRCQRLGVEYLVLHPGANSDEAGGLRLIAEALDEILARHPRGETTILLETTAGSGSSLGWRFEQLAQILRQSRRRARLGVCLDTCHVFAAGYDIRAPKVYRETMEQFDRSIGLGRLKAIHLNDSKKPFGSRVDRHEHIGQGQIGAKGLANFINDIRLADVPMILETPKGLRDDGVDWDEINAKAVRKLQTARMKDEG